MRSETTLSVTSTPSAWPAIWFGQATVPEVVEAAIARAERVNPELNAIVHAAFDRARAEAADPRGGFFAGVPDLPQGHR